MWARRAMYPRRLGAGRQNASPLGRAEARSSRTGRSRNQTGTVTNVFPQVRSARFHCGTFRHEIQHFVNTEIWEKKWGMRIHRVRTIQQDCESCKTKPYKVYSVNVIYVPTKRLYEIMLRNKMKTTSSNARIHDDNAAETCEAFHFSILFPCRLKGVSVISVVKNPSPLPAFHHGKHGNRLRRTRKGGLERCRSGTSTTIPLHFGESPKILITLRHMGDRPRSSEREGRAPVRP